MKGEIIMFKLLGKNRKGFTLIELIVVIAILAILAAIAIPTFSGITSEADAKVELANARNLATAINAYNNLNPDKTPISSITKPATEEARGSLEDTLDDLYPSSLGKTEAIAAMNLIIITDNVAVAAEPTATETPEED